MVALTMAVSSEHDTARLALDNAEVALRVGDDRVAAAWLCAALDECAGWLGRIDPTFRAWHQWRRFQEACELHPDYDHRLGWRDALRRSIAAARRAFRELEVAAAPEADGPDSAELACALEDLLDQVWRCERDWNLEDRLGG